MANEIAKAYVQIVPSSEGIAGSISGVLGAEATTAGLTAGTTLGTGLLANMKGMLIGGGIAAVVGIVVNALKACVEEASEFDASMSQVAATMGTSTDAIGELSDFAKEMGRTTAFSANEAAEGLNTLALAGLDADEQMEVLPNVMNLASAGAIDLDDAASYVTGTIKGFNAEMSDSEYFADLMAKGATLANTNVQDLGEALSGSAATAHSYGQEADSVTVALLRLAEQNVTGSDAATALNRAMADLYTPTDAAKQALEELGVSVYDESGTARDFNDVVDELNGALSGYDDETQNAYKDTIFTTRGLQAFNKMTVSSSETVDGFKEALADCSGSAGQQAETQLDNLQGDMTLFKSAMSGLKITIGEALTPALRGIVEFATGAITAFTDIITGNRTVGEVFNDVCDTISQKIFGEDWEGMGSFISNHILEPIGNLASNVWGSITDFCSNIIQGIQNIDWHEVGYELIQAILTGIKFIIVDIPQYLWEFIQAVWDFIVNTDWKEVGKTIFHAIINGIIFLVTDVPTMIWDFIQSIWDTIVNTDWLELGKNILHGIIDGMLDAVKHIGEKIGDFCGGIVDGIKDFFGINSPSTLMMEQGGYLVDGLVEGMSSMPDDVDGTLSDTASRISKWGKDSEATASDTGVGFVDKLNSGLSNVGDTVSKPLQNALGETDSWSKDSTKEADSTGTQFVDKLKNGIQKVTTTVHTPLTDAVSEATGWNRDMANEASSSGTQFVDRMKEGLSNLTARVQDQLNNVTRSTSNWGATISTSFHNMGQNVVNGMINGIGSMVGNLYNSIYNAMSGLVSRAQNALGIGSPSKVFRDEVGLMIGEGLALGIEESQSEVDDAMDDLLAVQETLADPFGISVDGGAKISNQNGMDTLLDLLNYYLPRLESMQMVTDTGTLVGELAPGMDRALGKRSAKGERQG